MDYHPAVATHESNALLAGLAPETLAAMTENLWQQTISQGQVLYEPGEKIDNAYFPQSGMISLLIATDAGDFVEATSIGREGGFGLRNGAGERRSFTRAVAQIGGKFSVLATKHLAHYSRHYSGFRDMIDGYTELRLAEAQQFAACNAAHDGSSRLARWLLQCADRTGSDMVPLTQEFLAQMLGIRRTTVTLLAQELQRLKMIKYNRGRISILDRAGLKARTCECYHITRHEKLALLIGLKN